MPQESSTFYSKCTHCSKRLNIKESQVKSRCQVWSYILKTCDCKLTKENKEIQKYELLETHFLPAAVLRLLSRSLIWHFSTKCQWMPCENKVETLHLLRVSLSVSVEKETESGDSRGKTYSLMSWLILRLICCIKLFTWGGRTKQRSEMFNDSGWKCKCKC